jgi:hypothetical protein
LIAAKLGRLPLQDVLNDLQYPSGHDIQELFDSIYRSTWMSLSGPARQLLMNIYILSPSGEDVGWLRMRGGLAEEQFEEALSQLTSFSLLQVTGTLERPLYRLHHLTITFLKTQLLAQWEEPS